MVVFRSRFFGNCCDFRSGCGKFGAPNCHSASLVPPFWHLGEPFWHLAGTFGGHGSSRRTPWGLESDDGKHSVNEVAVGRR